MVWCARGSCFRRERWEFLNSSYAGHVTLLIACPARDGFSMGWRVLLFHGNASALGHGECDRGQQDHTQSPGVKIPGSLQPWCQAAPHPTWSSQIPAAGREAELRPGPSSLAPPCASAYGGVGCF